MQIHACGDGVYPGALAEACACERTCERTHFATAAEFADCLEACADASAECMEDCAIDPEKQTELEDNLADCQTGCDTSQDACLVACNSGRAACESSCDEIEDPEDQANCYDMCFSSWLECRPPCYGDYFRCQPGCEREYLELLLPLQLAERECQLACCSTEEAHISVRLGDCEIAGLESGMEAQIAYLQCREAHIIDWNSPDFPVDDGFDCATPQILALYEADYEGQKCDYQARLDFGEEQEICDDYDECRQACLVTALDAQLACQTSYLGGGSEGAFVACTDAWENAKYDCEIDCCFARHGADEYTRPAKACHLADILCGRGIAPGCDPAPTCEPGSSPECDTEHAEHEACLDAGAIACEGADAACYDAIEAEPTCTGCATPFLP